MMDFATPRFLIWLWLVPVVALVLIAAERRRRPRVAAFVGTKAAAAQLLTGRTVFKVALRIVALAATIVALAGPRWGFAWQNVKRQGADIMLVVDVSRSMLAADIDPDRLTRARRELVDFLQLLHGDRIGLTAFAGEAFVQCPLTEDYGAARMFISLLQPELIPVQGTDIGRAIDVALKGLEDGSPGTSAGRAIVLITDGEDLQGAGQAAVERVKAAGVKLYTIGVGSQDGAPIPEPGGGFKKDASGALVMTKPDEATLQAMALATGGMYVRSVAGDMDLQRLYTEGIRAGVGQKEISSGREKLWFERYQWFLLLALLCLVLDHIVSDVRGVAPVTPNRRTPVVPRAANRREARRASVGLIIFLAVGVTAAPRADANPRDAFEAGDFPTAAAGFQDQEVGDPDQPAHSYNRALSQFKAGQYAEAAQGFERAASAAVEPRLKQDSWFNLGNARVGAGKLPEAKAAFEQALALDPGDRSARENLEYVKKLIEEQKKQQEQKQDEQQDQNQDQNQDQQQNDQKNDQSQPDEQQNQQDKPSEQDQQQNDQKDQQQQQDETQNDQQSESPKPDEAQQGQDEAQKPSDQAGAPQDEQQEPQRQAAQAGETKDMNEQEAERLLQSVEDQATKYHYRPEAERGAPPRQPEKDW